MERWSGKIAVVTGCSAGIGAQIGVDLVKAGLIVVGLARRSERVEELKQTLPKNVRENLHALKCDVSKEAEIVATFAQIEKQFGGVDLLVNNAGIGRKMQLTDDDNSEKVREILDTNVLGVVFCTREAVKSMKRRGDNGSIININSVVGHSVPFIPGMAMNIYPASKYAVTAITEALRQELITCNSKIRVTVGWKSKSKLHGD
jgi:NADP+-dependent farnesol dehydrogenase